MAIKIQTKITGFAVAKPDEAKQAKAIPAMGHIAIGHQVSVAEKSLRWPKRPAASEGFEGWTSDFVRTPAGKFVGAGELVGV